VDLAVDPALDREPTFPGAGRARENIVARRSTAAAAWSAVSDPGRERSRPEARCHGSAERPNSGARPRAGSVRPPQVDPGYCREAVGSANVPPVRDPGRGGVMTAHWTLPRAARAGRSAVDPS